MSENTFPDSLPTTSVPQSGAFRPSELLSGVLSWRLHWPGLALDLFLVALIAIGVGFRFTWVNWNQDTDLHPDEYGLTSTITQLAIPESFGDYFNTRLSPISPYQKYDENGQPTQSGPDNRMRWGQWPIILIRWTAEITDNTGYGELRLMGRRLSAAADSLALLVIFFFAWRLYNNHRVGLLAAALSGLAVMQIQQSHFMTADNFGVLFTALAMYCALRVAQESGPHPWPLPRRREHPGLPVVNQPLERKITARAGATGEGERFPPLFRVLRNGGGLGWGRDWLWYALFGLTFGMALAARINLAPLFGLVLAAAFIANANRLFGALGFAKKTAGEPAGSTTPLYRGPSGGTEGAPSDGLFGLILDLGPKLALAAVVAFLTFRVTQPMSFRAETGDTSLFTLHPNPDWVESMKVAQNESNGIGGGPPGEQWTNRPAIVFPLVNMVVWGMGLPLGLMAWAGFLWAAWRSVNRPNEWRAHLLPLVWAGGYFLFMGTRWVKSVRYFLPIYPFLILFAAWGLMELWQMSRRTVAGSRGAGVLGGIVGSPRLPRSPAPPLRWVFAASLFAIVTLGTLVWGWAFTGIYRQDNTRVQASRWIYQNISGPFNVHLQTPDGGTYTEPLPAPWGVQVLPDAPVSTSFKSHVDGTTVGFSVGHARSIAGEQASGRLHVALAADPGGQEVLAETDLSIEPDATHPNGGRFTASLAGAPLEKGRVYYVLVTAAEGAPIEVTGSTVANESWDEGMPLRIEERDGFGGLYRGLTNEARWYDDENKKQMFLDILAQSDYLILPSQRAIWSAPRLPLTYPMTMEYYRALFDGRLGFELAAHFQSPLQLGPLQISDVGGTIAWGRRPELPLFNNNLFAAEEAFSVYDHAPVWIFRKTEGFQLERAREILDSVDLTTVVVQSPRDVTTAPTGLMLPPSRLESQRAGGTWSEMFDRDGLLNRSHPVGVVAWWLAVILLGWIALPLTAAALPGLPDRGYPLAKVVALLVVGWAAWFLASHEILPYTRGTLAFLVLVLALVSAGLAWINRASWGEFLRANRRYVLIVEGLAFALFLFDLAIRFGNGDLWHPSFGGEKPMDLSYLNAVLKSTSFPPYDPWFAGGYINYYYFGFVIVGVLIKLVGIVPTLAYNLMLPTLFSCLGMGAFSVAFNLVAHWSGERETASEPSTSALPSAARPELSPEMGGGGDGEAYAPARVPTVEESPNGDEPDDSDEPMGLPILDEVTRAPQISPDGRAERPIVAWLRRLQSSLGILPHGRPNAYLAGLMAALMIVVLGNLGEVDTLIEGLKRTAETEGPRTTFPFVGSLAKIINGAYLVASGQREIPLGTGEWYWNATRIIPAPEETGPITEFPFFTFLYADLHAHMIALPLTVLALAWAVSAVLAREREGRRRLPNAAFWAVGGLAIGVLRPTNTWDFPTYLGLGVLAVAYATWRRRPVLDAQTLMQAGLRAAVLIGLSIVLYYPYSEWYVAGYTSAELWKGSKTTLESYLWIHGLFLFLIATFLVRETRQWLASVPASVVGDLRQWMGSATFALAALAALLALLWYFGYHITLVALPMLVWAAALALRPGLPEAKRAMLVCAAAGLALTLVVEVVRLKGDIDRMNTVFKFYLQVWTLFSISAAAALGWLWKELPAWRPNAQVTWKAALGILIAMAGFYTMMATSAKLRDRWPSTTVENPPRSLDGAAYMRYALHYDQDQELRLAPDLAAIEWLQDNVAGSPVIVEGHATEYKWGTRMTIYTGLPGALGWNWHQRQQRGVIPSQDAEVWERENAINEFYGTLDVDQARAFLEKYDVRYIVVGGLERAYYPADALQKFETMVNEGMLSRAFEQENTVIYQVVDNRGN